MAVESGYRHIVLDDQGRPLVEGTTMKVMEVVLGQQAHGWSPEEIQWQHLSLAQIHAAFTYYYDHRYALDQEVRQQLERVEEWRAESRRNSPVIRKLRDQGLI